MEPVTVDSKVQKLNRYTTQFNDVTDIKGPDRIRQFSRESIEYDVFNASRKSHHPYQDRGMEYSSLRDNVENGEIRWLREKDERH